MLRDVSAESALESAMARSQADTFQNTLPNAHPDIKTVEDAVKHPELFPSPEGPSGGVIQGPQGWGDTVLTAQLFKALEAGKKGQGTAHD
ncbi:hypothetical protein MPL3356_270023 [Mesorhizobium plurifarium]|uniref:Uncharacterized protein n=1 Tax=Mesorhizobium plurifarium TaxID=69974 RepID=A0A090DP68_MESPL|nr:hypothetical protein MPL3356_270023 [Mesorhizobium plurifarium]